MREKIRAVILGMNRIQIFLGWIQIQIILDRIQTQIKVTPYEFSTKKVLFQVTIGPTLITLNQKNAVI